MRVDFSDLVNDQSPLEGNPANGAVVGIVSGIVDDEKLSRVKVTFPSLGDSFEVMARVVVPMAGDNRGVRFPFVRGDEVLVIFGHLRDAYVIGAMWNGQEKPPTDDSNVSMIKSRSGHVIKLDDTAGSETIEIVDAHGKNSMVFDTATNSITISADQDITLAAPKGKISLSAKTIHIASSDDSKVTTEVTAGSGGMNVNATGDVFVKGKTINLN